MSGGDTQVRVYPASDSREFEQERVRLARDGWEVERIGQRENRNGCGLPLIGALMNRPQGEIVVTYRRVPDDRYSRVP